MVEITLTSLLAVLLGVLPGGPAEWIYAQAVGLSRHEADMVRGLRMLGFSILGLILYALVAREAGWPPVDHVVPATFGATFTAEAIPTLGIAYLGHVAGSFIAGLGAAGAHLVLRRAVTHVHVRDAWDHFIDSCVPDHWVVVRTKSGKSYVGIVEDVDVAVEPEYRDVVLQEPAAYEESANNYRTTHHQYLFIPGEEVVSVAVLYDPNADPRVTPVGELLFDEPITGEGHA